MAKQKVRQTKSASRFESNLWGDLQRERQRLRTQQQQEQMVTDEKLMKQSFDAYDNAKKKLEEQRDVYGTSKLEEVALKYYWDKTTMDQARVVMLKPRSLGYPTNMMSYFVPKVAQRKVTKAWVELEDGRKYELQLANCELSMFSDVLTVRGTIGAEVMSQAVLVLPPSSEEEPILYQRKFRKVDGGQE